MTHDPLRWGILSTARINRRLIPAIRAAERAELVAVASRSLDAAESYAGEWGISEAVGSYQALLDDPEIDVVYISLPNSLHAEWTVRAAQAGKHVLCEKPLALTVEDVDRITAAAGQAGVVVAEAVMYLYHPLLAEVRRLVRDGVLGEVSLVGGSFSFVLDRPGDVRLKPELGGGALWDIGSYPVSFIRWVLGEPDEVFAWQVTGDSGVDVVMAGVLRYGSAQLGAFDCSFRQMLRTSVEVVGTQGVLTMYHPFPSGPETRLVLRDANDDEQEFGDPRPDPYQCEVEALTAAVLDGTPLSVPLSSSRGNVAILTALYESARRGRPVARI